MRFGARAEQISAEQVIAGYYGQCYLGFARIAGSHGPAGRVRGDGLLMASVGIYGVIAYVVGNERRRSESAWRSAHAALDVLRLMLWEGMRLALTGIAMGTAAGLALTRLMSKMLYGVTATDPLTFFGVAIVLLLVALAACYLPARRAASVDPMQALHSE